MNYKDVRIGMIVKTHNNKTFNDNVLPKNAICEVMKVTKSGKYELKILQSKKVVAVSCSFFDIAIDYYVSHVVSLDQAKILKAYGFKGETYLWYVDHEDVRCPDVIKNYIKHGLHFDFNHDAMNHNEFDEFIYSAPLLRDKNVLDILNEFKNDCCAMDDLRRITK